MRCWKNGEEVWQAKIIRQMQNVEKVGLKSAKSDKGKEERGGEGDEFLQKQSERRHWRLQNFGSKILKTE